MDVMPTVCFKLNSSPMKHVEQMNRCPDRYILAAATPGCRFCRVQIWLDVFSGGTDRNADSLWTWF